MLILKLAFIGIFFALYNSESEQPPGRDLETEKICEDFLLDSATSPLMSLSDCPRNLTIDENYETICEKVLFDFQVPLEKKLHVHEGLGFLSVRHTEMGVNRYKNALRHFKALANTLTDNFMLQVRAAYWAMGMDLNKYKEASQYFYNAIYGGAKNDKGKKRHDSLKAKRSFALSLGYQGNFTYAQRELIDILLLDSNEFIVAFLLRESQRILNLQGIPSNDEVSKLLADSEEYYNNIMKHAWNLYSGFKPPIEWSPDKLSEIPTSAEFFANHIQLRKPVVISPARAFELSLGWKTNNLTIENLVAIAGNESVLIQTRPLHSNSTLGFGIDTYIKRRSFHNFLTSRYSKIISSTTTNTNQNKKKKKSSTIETEEFLIPQPPNSKKVMLRSPLHLFGFIIPRPSFLDAIWADMIEVNLGIGNARTSEGVSTRLTTDSLDKLYFNLKGNKTYYLYSPENTLSMRTIAPSYAVLKNGFSLQYQPKLASDEVSVDDDNEEEAAATSTGSKDVTTLFNSQATGIDDELLGEAKGKHVTVVIKPEEILFVPAGWFMQTHYERGQHQEIIFSWKPPGWQETVKLERQALAELTSKIGAPPTAAGYKAATKSTSRVESRASGRGSRGIKKDNNHHLPPAAILTVDDDDNEEDFLFDEEIELELGGGGTTATSTASSESHSQRNRDGDGESGGSNRGGGAGGSQVSDSPDSSSYSEL